MTAPADTASELFISGITLMAIALMLDGVSVVLMPLAGRRPRRGGRAARRTKARLDSVVTAFERTGRWLPVADVSAALACRDQVARRALALVAPGFVVASLGVIVAATGQLWRMGPWRSAAEEQPELKLAGLMVGYLALVGMCLLVQRQIYNWNADYFAAYSLLRAAELVVDLDRARVAADLAGIDQVAVRRELSGQLRSAAGYVRRLIGKALPMLAGKDELRLVTAQAEDIAAGFRGWQVLAVSGSPDELARLLPALGDALAALVQHRFRDLPRIIDALAAVPPDDGPRTGPSSGGTAGDLGYLASERQGPATVGEPGLILSGDDRHRLCITLAEIFHEAAEAGMVLDSIDFPRGRRPSWHGSNPEIWWSQVFDNLDSGIVQDAYRRLLRAARARRPHNAMFAEIARRHGMSDEPHRQSFPPADGAQRAGWGISQWIRRKV
ncbi:MULTISPECIES: effector-associated domain EAD1-containing protein [Pseudofrankia]|uniref:effector-associated domain EAD1-containing protein n=1 Tax=Pseudofrankia TaxID=2994363 RepID=UPI000234D6BF|nr:MULTISPECIES: effector-associated domain EAD1-containing protein [Pseudofrankia]OHV41566.1 hypothetical protein BCD49_01075 [Pseudofrankia sp. EUN1h]